MAGDTVTLGQAKELLNYTIDNNIALKEKGRNPIAVGLIAEAGIGKTSIVREVAKERGMTLIKLNISQIDEQGDLLGFPQIEYECQAGMPYKDADGKVKVKVLDRTVWLNAKQLQAGSTQVKYRQTGKTRMGYARPAWVPEYNENGTILLLDDFNRGNSALQSAVMDLILEQGYISWKMPEKTTVVLTANPDDGSYNVSSLDAAQSGRYVGFSVEWDEAAWTEWAEKAGIDGRCINFVLSYSNELFSVDGEGNRICDPRSFTMFADMISGVKDWDSPESLSFITTVAKGCFHDGGKFPQMFGSFIRNKMHLLIQPKEMLTGAWKDVRAKLEATLYDSGGQYRPDIASILERRFSGYIGPWLDSDGKTPIATVQSRLKEFISAGTNGGKRLFTRDLLYHMVKTITSGHRAQTSKLLHDPEITKILN